MLTNYKRLTMKGLALISPSHYRAKCDFVSEVKPFGAAERGVVISVKICLWTPPPHRVTLPETENWLLPLISHLRL